MAKRLNRIVLSSLLFARTIPPRTILLAHPVSTIQKTPEPSDLFEYTSGRWMYVAG